MNYLQRSFQISFALHALAVLLLIFMGDRFISSEKMLVIDFTLEDTTGAQDAGIGAAVKAHMSKPNTRQEDIAKKDAELAEIPAKAVPQATPPVSVNSAESPGVEIRMPAVHNETTTSSTGKRNSTGKDITDKSSGPLAVVDMNAVPGQGLDNSADAGRNKYLKANLSYINNLVNRHITYPKKAWKMGLQGRVEISFFISSDGYPKRINIMKSSGSGSLDRNAVEALKSASPFPKAPVDTKITIPVLYQLH